MMIDTLKGMSRVEYYKLKHSGMFWEFHPKATGSWVKDTGGLDE